jgi:hypothetical protein
VNTNSKIGREDNIGIERLEGMRNDETKTKKEEAAMKVGTKKHTLYLFIGHYLFSQMYTAAIFSDFKPSSSKFPTCCCVLVTERLIA